MEVFCPYRICPIGAHIDHQYGVVCGSAINLGVRLIYEINEEPYISISSINFEGSYEFKIGDTLIKKNDWADYFRGVIEIVKKKYILNKGLSGTFKGDLVSGGISSSTASQIAFLLALLKVNDILLSKDEIIDIVYHVELDFLNLSIGILDPACEVFSKKNSLMFFDTLTKHKIYVDMSEFNFQYQFILITSAGSRKLCETKYNDRVNELKKSYYKLGIKGKSGKLRDVPDYYFYKNMNSLTEVEKKRTLHYYEESNRVRESLYVLRCKNYKEFGNLINDSCVSSITKYECGSERLIALFKITRETTDVLGTRFLGAGFNGSSIALIKKCALYDIIKNIKTKFLELYPELVNDFKIIPITLEDGVVI